MRKFVFTACVAFVTLFGSAASAGTFPDLPGMELAESVASGETSVEDGASRVEARSAADGDRVPAPDPGLNSRKVVDEATTPDQTAVVVELPGGAAIPLVGEAARASNGSEVALLAGFALVVCVLFTRFLVRLNSI